jgi:hypothetical protein
MMCLEKGRFSQQNILNPITVIAVMQHHHHPSSSSPTATDVLALPPVQDVVEEEEGPEIRERLREERTRWVSEMASS